MNKAIFPAQLPDRELRDPGRVPWLTVSDCWSTS